MANEHKIEVNKRENNGKKDVKHLRREKNIPGIYYSSRSKSSTPIFISHHEYDKALKSGSRIFNISVGDKKQNVLFKSVQYHPVTEEVLHVDLYGIDMNKPINIKIPVNLIGTPIGVTDEGGILNQAFNEIEIQCLPSDVPDLFEADISELALGSSINVGNIEIDENFTLITPKETVIASVTHAMQEIEPEIEETEDEIFLDEEGEPIVEGESKDGAKPTEGGEDKQEEKASESK